MDRLTINLPFTDGNPCYHYVDKEAAYNGSQKLGQYEDIGNPEELAALKAENEALRKQLENSVQLPKDRWVITVDSLENPTNYLIEHQNPIANFWGREWHIGYEVIKWRKIYEVCTTKESAEARLNELQGEQQ